MRIRNWLCYFCMAFAIGSGAFVRSQVKSIQSKKDAKAKELTLEQIQKLVASRIPDDIVAKEISSRGVSGDVSREFINSIRQKGAGAQTLNALSAQLPRASVVIKTTAGAEVFVGGRRLGVADESEGVNVSGLEPGRYRILIRKNSFKTIDQEFDLPGRKLTQLNLPLEWAVGFLTIRTGNADARISIEGAGRYSERVENLSLAPGTYKISVSAPMRETATLNVSITAGQIAAPEIALNLDRAQINSLQSSIAEDFNSRHFHSVIQIARNLAHLIDLDRDSSAMLALSLWAIKDYPAFQLAAHDALAKRAELEFTLDHHHSFLKSHPATITVTSAEFRFRAIGSCTTKPFSSPIKNIRAEAKRVVDEGRNYEALSVTYPDPKNPKKTEKVNFLMQNAEHLQALLNLLQSLQ